MRYRKLGKTGLRVSEIGLGTWPVGGSILLGDQPTGYGQVPESEARRGIERALELGVNFFDASDSYGLGRAERILGACLAGRAGQVTLATKAGWVPDGTQRWMKDLSREHLIAAAQRCRTRLSVETLDVFQLHALPSAGEETSRCLDTLDELKTRGVIRFSGVSVGADFEAGLRFVRGGGVDLIQVHYNLLNQGAAVELLDEALAARVGVIASIPLDYGFLSGRYTRATKFPRDDWRSRLTPEEIALRLERVGEFRFLSADGIRTLVHAALQFVLAHPAVATAIPGFRNPEQVESLVAALEARPLSDIELARARELGLRRFPAKV